eukprot:TRINITY_DN1301_c2_g1_i1.p1 TRINITY_DN1301_c2_g1~~TRINITY_DN1301_c2_g1_i1.p1  ORF type:complete len:995 (-),score=153.32 TRINITY_DN1301_c2_g1_i1:1271-4255(-)
MVSDQGCSVHTANGDIRHKQIGDGGGNSGYSRGFGDQVFNESHVKLKWSNGRKTGAGYGNLGNTCYMNSVLQVLVHTPPLAELYLSGNSPPSNPKHNPPPNCPNTNNVDKRLHAVLRHSFNCQQRRLDPRPIVAALGIINRFFRPGRQQDAHEFLVGILDRIHENYTGTYVNPKLPQHRNKLKNSTDLDSYIMRIFGGKLRSKVQCMDISYQSACPEVFTTIGLEIHKCQDIETALRYFFREELLDGANKYKCPLNNQFVRATKKYDIIQPPNVLILHLKRFSFGHTGRKIDHHVQYNNFVNLSRHICQQSMLQQYNHDYQLYGVVVHLGHSLHGGHYIAYVRAGNGRWFRMDDENVCAVSEGEVFRQRAYILFYIRQSPRSWLLKKSKSAQGNGDWVCNDVRAESAKEMAIKDEVVGNVNSGQVNVNNNVNGSQPNNIQIKTQNSQNLPKQSYIVEGKIQLQIPIQVPKQKTQNRVQSGEQNTLKSSQYCQANGNGATTNTKPVQADGQQQQQFARKVAEEQRTQVSNNGFIPDTDIHYEHQKQQQLQQQERHVQQKQFQCNPAAVGMSKDQQDQQNNATLTGASGSNGNAKQTGQKAASGFYGIQQEEDRSSNEIEQDVEMDSLEEVEEEQEETSCSSLIDQLGSGLLAVRETFCYPSKGLERLSYLLKSTSVQVQLKRQLSNSNHTNSDAAELPPLKRQRLSDNSKLSNKKQDDQQQFKAITYEQEQIYSDSEEEQGQENEEDWLNDEEDDMAMEGLDEPTVVFEDWGKKPPRGKLDTGKVGEMLDNNRMRKLFKKQINQQPDQVAIEQFLDKEYDNYTNARQHDTSLNNNNTNPQGSDSRQLPGSQPTASVLLSPNTQSQTTQPAILLKSQRQKEEQKINEIVATGKRAEQILIQNGMNGPEMWDAVDGNKILKYNKRGGGKGQINRIQRMMQTQSQSYNEEYDRGKQKKIKSHKFQNSVLNQGENGNAFQKVFESKKAGGASVYYDSKF